MIINILIDADVLVNYVNVYVVNVFVLDNRKNRLMGGGVCERCFLYLLINF